MKAKIEKFIHDRFDMVYTDAVLVVDGEIKISLQTDLPLCYYDDLPGLDRFMVDMEEALDVRVELWNADYLEVYAN